MTRWRDQTAPVWNEVIASKPNPELAKRFFERWLELAKKYDAETSYGK